MSAAAAPERSGARRTRGARSAAAALAATLLAGLAACGGDASPARDGPCRAPAAGGARPDPRALADRPLPPWFDDAKLGILVHWGLYSVPAWAETALDPADWMGSPLRLLARGDEWYARNPYAEWYANTFQLPGSAAAAHRAATWGAGASYESFRPRFERAAGTWRPAAWARLFRQAGARYVVLVTKHHDGFALWPSAVPHPVRPDGWHATRDYVGELARAVRAECLRFGTYYSGGLDWSVEPGPIATYGAFLANSLDAPEALAYVAAQWRELIARYAPSVLWNDVSMPLGAAPLEVMADYYAAVPDGVVNDRWGPFPGSLHHDYATPEYRTRPQISERKFETVRGIGRSFGYNANETESDRIAPAALVRLLADVVSKNGNLLLNVGPRADGTIPDGERARLLALGDWLAVHGEAIHATRPWRRAEATAHSGEPVRFTWRAATGTLYAIVLADLAPGRELRVALDAAERPTRVRLLGSGSAVVSRFDARDGTLAVKLPDDRAAFETPVLALTLPAA